MTYDLKSQLTIKVGTKLDYFLLDRYHCLNTPLPPVKKVYVIRAKRCAEYHWCKNYDWHGYGHAELIGVIVYSTPLRDLRARTKATAGFFKQPKSLSDRLRLINKHISYVSRLVILPSYRLRGLGDWLWRETLKLQTTSVVESLTTMPVNEKWLNLLGFQVSYQPDPDSIRKLRNAFRRAHISDKCLTIPQIAQKRVDALLGDEKVKLERSIHDFMSKYRAREHMPNDIKRMTYILSKIPYPNGYLIWFNPYLDHNPVLDWINEQKTW